MPVTVNHAPSTSAHSDSATTIDFTGLTVGAGADRAIVATIQFGLPMPAGLTLVWDPTGANQSLTPITNAEGDQGSYCSTTMFGLVNPTAGNKTLRASWTGTHEVTLGAIALNGVLQTGGDATFAHGTSDASLATSPLSMNVTSAAGNMVIGSFVSAAWTLDASAAGTEIYFNSTGATTSGTARRYDGAASVTASATYSGGTNAGAAAAADVVASVAAINLTLGDRVLTNGLAALSDEADAIYICSDTPASYAEATGSKALGFKNFGTGNCFGDPASWSGGREVVSAAIVDGTITADSVGGAKCWAAVTTGTSRLLAFGPLDDGQPLTNGEIFTLDSFAVRTANP